MRENYAMCYGEDGLLSFGRYMHQLLHKSRTSLCVSLGRCFDSLVVYRRAEKSMKAYKASALAKRGGIFR